MGTEAWNKSFATNGKTVSVEQVLQGRDLRVQAQKDCLARFGKTLLSVTLVAPGSIKKNELLDYIFQDCLTRVGAYLTEKHLKPLRTYLREKVTGSEAIFVLPISAPLLKKEMLDLEERALLGRFWDLDVIGEDAVALSRRNFGLKDRACWICGCDARVCSRNRHHSPQELQKEMHRRATWSFFGDWVAQRIHAALLAEVYLTPKPGLVDRTDSGAHNDMDLFSFRASADRLRHYWKEFYEEGIRSCRSSGSEVLSQLRVIGLRAEQAMLEATDGVNTHKGAVFLFGLVAAALGRQVALQLSPREISVEHICNTIGDFTVGIVDELKRRIDPDKASAGEKIFQRYGYSGARGEAAAGYPLVLSALRDTPRVCDSEHQQLLWLLYLMANNNDTNVVHRGGVEGLLFVQSSAKWILSDPKALHDKNTLIQQLNSLNAECIKRNLSPGGSADLLALTLFFNGYLQSLSD